MTQEIKPDDVSLPVAMAAVNSAIEKRLEEISDSIEEIDVKIDQLKRMREDLVNNKETLESGYLAMSTMLLLAELRK